MKPGFQREYHDFRDCHWMEKLGKRVSRRLDVWVRLACMLAMAGLLLYCSWVTGTDGWDEHIDCPAKCALGRPKGGEPMSWMIVNFVFVVWGYLPWIVMLSGTLQAKRIASNARERIVDRQPSGQDWKELPRYRRIWIWIWYLGKSETLQFLTDGLLWFAYGTAVVFIDRKKSHGYFENNDVWASEEEKGKEDDIEGFGQLVALLLVGVPLLQVLQIYCGKSHLHDLYAKE